MDWNNLDDFLDFPKGMPLAKIHPKYPDPGTNFLHILQAAEENEKNDTSLFLNYNSRLKNYLESKFRFCFFILLHSVILLQHP